MSNNSGLAAGVWEAFISFLYKTGEIFVSDDFHDRCGYVFEMMDNDITGIAGTIVNYSINSASEARFTIECSDESLEELLRVWLERINININGVPTGLQELAKEYYKERWAGASLCLLRVDKWEKISIGANSISVPTVLYFVVGSSVYIKRSNAKSYKLGSDKYFLDEGMKDKPLPVGKDENIIVQKPFGRWFTEYPTPYLIKQGVYKNWKALQILQNKGNEVITKILPYLFIMEKGTENMFLQNKGSYTDDDLKTMVTNFKEALERFNKEGGKLPATGIPFDQQYKHLIPDLLPILREELFAQGTRAILSGLGFVDVIQGVSSTRKESVLNPKPFIAEVNAGVDGFKSILLDVVRLIISENKLDHKKLFSENNSLKVVNSPLKINIETLVDFFRSGYVYGPVTIKTYHEVLGIDHEQEVERMKKEEKDGLRKLFYPHLVQNTEKDPDTTLTAPPKVTKKQEEKKVEKEKAEQEIEEAVTQEDLIIAPYTYETYPTYLKKYPADARKVWIDTFNESLPKGEDYAFPVAWTVLKKYLKRHYIQKDGKYIRKGQESAQESAPITAEEISDERVDKLIKLEKVKLLKSQKKLVDKLIKEDKTDENL